MSVKLNLGDRKRTSRSGAESLSPRLPLQPVTERLERQGSGKSQQT